MLFPGEDGVLIAQVVVKVLEKVLDGGLFNVFAK